MAKEQGYMDDKQGPQSPDVDDLIFQGQDPAGVSQR